MVLPERERSAISVAESEMPGCPLNIDISQMASRKCYNKVTPTSSTENQDDDDNDDDSSEDQIATAATSTQEIVNCLTPEGKVRACIGDPGGRSKQVCST